MKFRGFFIGPWSHQLSKFGLLSGNSENKLELELHKLVQENRLMRHTHLRPILEKLQNPI